MIDSGVCPDETPCADELKLPGMLEMAQNLMRDSGKVLENAIKGNSTLVSDDVRSSRWSICQGCPKLKNDRCVECGCFMKVKVAFVTSECPVGNW